MSTTTSRQSPTSASSGLHNCYVPDLDCKNFSTQEQAQARYNYCSARSKMQKTYFLLSIIVAIAIFLISIVLIYFRNVIGAIIVAVLLILIIFIVNMALWYA